MSQHDIIQRYIKNVGFDPMPKGIIIIKAKKVNK